MADMWDLYLDHHDAATLLEAAAVVEELRAVREPLPLHEPSRLLERLRTIARLSAEDAVNWDREAADRREDAEVDGGRWGAVDVARRMAELAERFADAERRVAAAAAAAVDDLSPRLADRDGTLAGEVDDRAREATRQLLEELGIDPPDPAR